MKKTHIYVLSPLAIVLLLIGGYVTYLFLLPNFHTQNGEKQYLYIHDNDKYGDVINRLEEASMISNKKTFNQVAHLLKYENHIKPGRYQVTNDMNNFSLIQKLRRGIQTPVNLTFNNIRTKEQLCELLSNELEPDYTDFFNLLNDSAFLVQYNLNGYTSIAVFMPNSYQVYWNTTAKKLFEKMHRQYSKFWNEKRKEQAAEIPLTPAQVMTLASIVDGETNVPKDRPLVAGLYINRLRKNMPLQADPTIKFALNNFALRRILKSDTHINSPYNTYKHTGLPPGPISIPNPQTIDAVLNYTKSDYIYMCAKETLNGEHNFAATFAEHQVNARKYQQALNDRDITR